MKQIYPKILVLADTAQKLFDHSTVLLNPNLALVMAL
jgi:hypothetical protein